MDSQRFNLTQGSITRKLLMVSLPIIGTQLMLMGYNLVDMFLLGRVGSGAVAASGSAGMFMWLSGGLMLVGRMGSEIGVAQSKGRRDNAAAMGFSHDSLFLAIVLSLVFAAACLLIPDRLIGFLNIQEADIAQAAQDYLFIIGMGMPALFISSAISGAFTGAGNSRAPFFVNAIGLGLNAGLDPLFIFTLGMGVQGAAWATIISQNISCLLCIYWLLYRRDRPFPHFVIRQRPDMDRVRQILRWSVPVSIENMLFTFFSMVVARQVALFGADAITVIRVGSQVESLCWLICLGFSSGITAFIGQNYGAGLWMRIRRGLRLSLLIITAWGLLVTALFLTFGREITGLFVPEERIAEMGEVYLRILAMSQVFFCLESIAAGAFRGLGRTTPPSIASIISNGARAPLAYLVPAMGFGLPGMWWVISITASIRGAWVFAWFLLYSRTKPVDDVPPTPRPSEVSSDVPSVRILP